MYGNPISVAYGFFKNVLNPKSCISKLVWGALLVLFSVVAWLSVEDALSSELNSYYSTENNLRIYFVVKTCD